MAQRCNHIFDCDDGSDELLSICSSINILSKDVNNINNNYFKTSNTSNIFFDYWICNNGLTMIKKSLVKTF